MSLEDVPRCQHIKVNGTQCGSPALRRRRLCFFHDKIRRERAKIAADNSSYRRCDLPLLEDANSVQIALMKVIQMLGSGQLDHKTAGLMLYALQTASSNLKNTDFEVDDVDTIVIDRDTVHETCINGPQWFEDDFEEEESERVGEDDEIEEDDDVEEDDDDVVVSEPAAKAPAATIKPNGHAVINSEPSSNQSKQPVSEDSRKPVQSARAQPPAALKDAG